MKIKNGDFIEIDYVAKIKSTGEVFDITEKDKAEKNNIRNKNIEYKPIVICVGKRDVIPGLDEFLVGKELGNFTVEISSEKAFGKKDPKLIKLMSASLLRKQKIEPIPGLKINMDGFIGTIVSVSGGRTLMDFNNPLAGKDVIYELKINKVITDAKDKLKSFLSLYLTKKPDFEIKDDEAIIKFKKLDDKVKEIISDKIKERIIEIKKVTFIEQPLENK